jgi:hypothetical protein
MLEKFFLEFILKHKQTSVDDVVIHWSLIVLFTPINRVPSARQLKSSGLQHNESSTEPSRSLRRI